MFVFCYTIVGILWNIVQNTQTWTMDTSLLGIFSFSVAGGLYIENFVYSND